MYKTIQTSTLRTSLAEVLNSIKRGDQYLVIKRGQPVAGLLSAGLFEDFLALNSRRFVNSIKKAREEVKKGEVYSHEEVFKDIA